MLHGLTPEQLGRVGLTVDGWSIKDLLWHVAHWCGDAARALGEMAEGTWDGNVPSLEPGWTDQVNRREFGRSSAMDLPKIREAWRGQRRAMLEALGKLEEVSPAAAEWFDEAGAAHYREHLPDLERWATNLRSRA